MRAPINGTSHLNNLNLKIATSLSCLIFCIIQCISSTKLSRIKRKISKSPIIAPSPPNKATPHIELAAAISKRTTPAGAAVNMDTKNIPATKLPIIFHLCALVSIPANTPVFAKMMATKILKTIIPKSRAPLLFRLLMVSSYEFFKLKPFTRLVSAYISWLFFLTLLL